jgi:hypothetical protein
MNEAYKKCLEEKALKIEEKVDRNPVNTDASSRQIKQGNCLTIGQTAFP